MNLEELLEQVVQTTRPHALWILFGASMMEYVFPPFPGDTVTLLGAYYSVVGVLPIPWVFLAVTTGSVTGSALDYWIGMKLRDYAQARPQLPFLLRWLSLDKIKKIEESWRRRGDALILFNRFIPAIRGLFFVAAGMGRIRFTKVMLLGAASAALWNAILLGVGYLAGANLDRLQRIFAAYSTLAWSVLGLVFLLLVGRVILRKRRERRERDRREEERACPH